MPAEITPEEQLDYLESSSSLMLWFAREWAKAHPSENFRSIIRKRTDIYRRTDFNPEWLDYCGTGLPEGWLNVLDELEKIYLETKADSSSKDFEKRCIDLLHPHFVTRVERDIAAQPSGTQKTGYQCGSLRYDSEPAKNNPQRIGFHIANACYPASPFDDPLYMASCLLVLSTQCAAKFGVTEIGTGTWMNSLPKWLELFPKEWQENMGPPSDDIAWHYGFWGQFITARRGFNHKLGAQFRKSGKIPYVMRSSWCSISSLRKHLETKFFSQVS